MNDTEKGTSLELFYKKRKEKQYQEKYKSGDVAKTQRCEIVRLVFSNILNTLNTKTFFLELNMVHNTLDHLKTLIESISSGICFQI